MSGESASLVQHCQRHHSLLEIVKMCPSKVPAMNMHRQKMNLYVTNAPLQLQKVHVNVERIRKAFSCSFLDERMGLFSFSRKRRASFNFYSFFVKSFIC